MTRRISPPASDLPNTENEPTAQAAIDELIICGAMSHMCIDATTRAAVDAGFGCVVATDACATRDLVYGDHTVSADKVHHAFMAALGSVYATIIESATFS